MQCPNCHYDCPEESVFCCQCGRRLSGEPSSFFEKLKEMEPSLFASEDAQETQDSPDPAPAEWPDAETWPGIEEQDASVSKKTGSRLAPILVMLGMLCLGLLVFFLKAPADVRVSAEYPYLQVDAAGSLSCTTSYASLPDTVTVPETIGGRQVLSLEDSCFAGASIATAILPQGLESVGSYAFSGCADLRGIFLPDSVTSVGDRAFFGCTALEAICIPNTVTEMGTNVFDGCTALRYVFYSGTFAQWRALYPGYLSPSVYVFCLDGTYRQNSGQ